MSDTKVKFPAAYSRPIVVKLCALLDKYEVSGTVLDPFAGPGASLDTFVTPKRRVVGVEIEQPLVDAGSKYVQQGDSTKLPRRWAGRFAAVVTSPTYGNRFADHHNAADQSRRRSYTHDMREMTGDNTYVLDEHNTGRHHFGVEYQRLHRLVWAECTRVTTSDALFFLNVSNFVRKGEIVRVDRWHETTLRALGWQRVERRKVATQRMKYGENHDARVDSELIIVFRKTAS